jgi:hypothetical protein
MRWDELLKAFSHGKMPSVKVENIPEFSTSNVGVVSVIKDNGRHRGVGVVFPGLKYDTWFHDSDGTDKRSKYLRDLHLVVESSSPYHNDIVQETEGYARYSENFKDEQFHAGRLSILNSLIPKLKQIGEGSESYWKKRCEGLYRALQGLVNDVRSKPNDTRYNTHLKIAEALLKSSIGEETEGQDGWDYTQGTGKPLK